MSFQQISDKHDTVSESDAPRASPSAGSEIGEATTGPPAKIRKIEPTTDDPHPEQSADPPASKPVSSPCTCRCGGCCCHGTSPEPQHCVRCHDDYRLNHPGACTLPHTFATDSYGWEGDSKDFKVPSVCCGEDALCDVQVQGRELPFPCFVGWHTTDVDTVEDQYNGINILRCDLGPGGKCLRSLMKYPLHYDALYDESVKHIQVDEGDHERHLMRKREQIKNDEDFRQKFGMETDWGDESEGEEELGYEKKMGRFIRKASRGESRR